MLIPSLGKDMGTVSPTPLGMSNYEGPSYDLPVCIKISKCVCPSTKLLFLPSVLLLIHITKAYTKIQMPTAILYIITNKLKTALS